jgi:hypothetical protein
VPLPHPRHRESTWPTVPSTSAGLAPHCVATHSHSGQSARGRIDPTDATGPGEGSRSGCSAPRCGSSHSEIDPAAGASARRRRSPLPVGDETSPQEGWESRNHRSASRAHRDAHCDLDPRQPPDGELEDFQWATVDAARRSFGAQGTDVACGCCSATKSGRGQRLLRGGGVRGPAVVPDRVLPGADRRTAPGRPSSGGAGDV